MDLLQIILIGRLMTSYIISFLQFFQKWLLKIFLREKKSEMVVSGNTTLEKESTKTSAARTKKGRKKKENSNEHGNNYRMALKRKTGKSRYFPQGGGEEEITFVILFPFCFLSFIFGIGIYRLVLEGCAIRVHFCLSQKIGETEVFTKNLEIKK